MSLTCRQCIVGVLIAIVSVCVLFFSVLVPYAIDKMRDSHAFRSTNMQLVIIMAAAEGYRGTHGAYPVGSFGDFTKELAACRTDIGYDDHARAIMRARDGDGWGRPYVYAQDGDGRWYCVRSVGSNGIDELGAGDDLEVSDSIPDGIGVSPIE